MALQRTFVYMVVEWDDATTCDPRKWDWNGIVAEDGNGETVTEIGTFRIVERMTSDSVQELMDDVTQVAGDKIGDYVCESEEE